MSPSQAAKTVVAALDALRSDAELEKVRKRIQPDEEAFGVRMGKLFEVAKAHTDLSMSEVDRLLDHPAYEPRMAAMCILDFKARKGFDDDGIAAYRMYLGRHDRITTWDMVDRAAPRVVGGYLCGRSPRPLQELSDSASHLERRTAITAPLYFVRAGSDEDLAAGFDIAGRLAADPEPVVHKAVGIFVKHAGTRSPERLRSFLEQHAGTMHRSGLRLAIEKLDTDTRSHYLSR